MVENLGPYRARKNARARIIIGIHLSRFARLATGLLSLRLGLVFGLFGPALVLAPLQAPLLGGSALLSVTLYTLRDGS